MVSTQVRQSKGSGLKSRSGQIAYCHGVKTRLSTSGTGDVPRGSEFTKKQYGPSLTKLGEMKVRLERLEVLTWGVSVISGIRLGLDWEIGDSR